MKLLGSDTPLRLTHDPAQDRSPAWSPDGASIAFGRREASGAGAVYVIPSIGGAERKITPFHFKCCDMGPYISWSPDGKWLAVAEGEYLQPPSLYLVSLATGERRRLTTPPAGMADRAPTFSPDGRYLMFSREVRTATAEIFYLPLTADYRPAGKPRQVTFRKLWTISSAWYPDGRQVLFASGDWDGSTKSLWTMDLFPPGRPRRLEFAGHEASAPAMSRNGRLIYTQTRKDANIWRADLKGGAASTPLIASTKEDVNPQFSPDGTRIVFPSTRSGHSEIWVCDADGENPLQLTDMRASITGSPRWSPDGRWIAFDSNKEGQFEVYVMAADGGAPRRLTYNPAADGVASWSRDGRWIYFMSNRSGRAQVWKAPSAGGDAVQVTRDGGYVAFESLDGRWLYYSKMMRERAGDAPLFRIPTGGGKEEPVLDRVGFLCFALVAEGIYYIPVASPAEHRREYEVDYLDFETRSSRRVLSFNRHPAVGLAVSPDGGTLLFSTLDEAGSNLMIAEGVR